jgi:8-oxo-dGTP diphosphatase
MGCLLPAVGVASIWDTIKRMDAQNGLSQRTLCILLRAGEVLLGYKKVRYGAGKYTGFGGKVEAGETVRAAAARELEEECSLRVEDSALEEAGRLIFLFPHKAEWSQEVHVFRVYQWMGEPVESEEMRPEWFALDRLPYARMWQDAPAWLPRVLNRQPLGLRFTFRADNETLASVEEE